MALLPKVRLKTLVSFPANVIDGVGVDVTKENGTYRFDLAFNDYAPPVGSIADPANQNVLAWNAVTGQYALVPIGFIGLSEAPLDSKLYGRQMAGWTEIVPGGVGSGDVTGPTGATNNNAAIFDGTTGKIIKQAGGTLTSGFALISGDPSVAPSWQGFLQAGVGAVTRSWQDRGRETVSLLDFIPVAEHAAIRAGTSTTNVAPYVQAAIDSGALNIYAPAGLYQVNNTIVFNDKIGMHFYGDGGGSNGLGATKFCWGGAAGGLVIQTISCQSCMFEQFAIQGIFFGTPRNPGIGLYVYGENATGPTHWNTYRNISVSSIGGSPGYGILLGSATNDDIATNVFEDILIVSCAVCFVQHGNQTVHNPLINVQALDYTQKGFFFIDGDVRMDFCACFGADAATVDVEIGTGCLWATIRDSYHEIQAARPAGACGFHLPTGTRAYLTKLDGVRVMWDRPSGNIINDLQRGPITFDNCTWDGNAGAATLTVNNGGPTAKALTYTNNHEGITITRNWTNVGVVEVNGTRKQTIFIPASAMVPRLFLGAAPGTVEMPTNRNMFKTLDFEPILQQEHAQFDIWFPKSWNRGTVTFQPMWSHAVTGGPFGVVWQLAGVARSDDDPGDVAFGTGVNITEVGGTTNDIYLGAESGPVTIAGSPAVGDCVQFQIARLISDAGDNLQIDARLHGVRVFYTTNHTTDA